MSTLGVITVGAMVILLLFCLGSVWAAHMFIKDMMEESERNKRELGPTEPTKYMGPEDEPRWEVYSRNIGKWR